MKKIFTSILLLGMLLVSGVARAQFSAEIYDDQRTGWCEGPDVVFSLSEIAKQMNITTGQIVDALDEWSAAAGDDTNGYTYSGIFDLENSNVTPVLHSEQYGGFEMDKDGNFGYWTSSTTMWGIYPHYWDIESDEFALTVCQVPGHAPSEGIECHGTVSLNILGGKATFDITLHINGVEAIDKEAVTDLSQLNIVGETSVEMTQEPYTGWENTAYSIPTPDLAEALGLTDEQIADKFSQMVFAKQWDSNNEKWGDLTADGQAVPSPGFYFGGGIYEEGSEEESIECQNLAYGSGDLFWICNLQYDSDNQAVTCYMGQYPYAMSLDETRKADIYIVYGDKAYIVHYTFTVGTPAQEYITDRTKVGEESWAVVDRDPRNTWNVLEQHDLDIAAILAKFTEAAGTEVKAEDLYLVANNKYNGMTESYTADNYDGVHGFWLSEDGAAYSYSDDEACFYIDYVAETTDEEGNPLETPAYYLALGNKPNYFDGGESAGASLYLVYNDQYYYEIKTTMTVMLPQYTLEQCLENVIEKNLSVQLIPTTDGSWQTGTTDVTYLEEALGAADAAFYGVTVDGQLTNKYSVSEASSYGGGGFWMSANDENGMAYAASYTGSGAFAIWYYESEFNWFAVPYLEATQAGTSTNGTFYMVDFWNGKALKVNVHIDYVDHIIDLHPLGTLEVAANARNDEGDDFDEQELDLTDVYTTLNCSEDDFAENATWMVLTESGSLTADNFDEMYGYSFDADGNAIESMDDAVFTLGFIDGKLRSYVVDDKNVGNTYATSLYIQYNQKLYEIAVTIGTPTAIKTVKASAADAQIYDLAGRAVSAPAKGIYIQNGKKVMVK